MGISCPSTETRWIVFCLYSYCTHRIFDLPWDFERCTRSLNIIHLFSGDSSSRHLGTLGVARFLHSPRLRLLGAFPSPPITGSFFLFLRFFTVVMGVVVIVLAGETGGGGTSAPLCLCLVVGAAFLVGPSFALSLSDTSCNISTSFGFEPNGIPPVGMNRPFRRCSGWM